MERLGAPTNPLKKDLTRRTIAVIFHRSLSLDDLFSGHNHQCLEIIIFKRSAFAPIAQMDRARVS